MTINPLDPKNESPVAMGTKTSAFISVGEKWLLTMCSMAERGNGKPFIPLLLFTTSMDKSHSPKKGLFSGSQHSKLDALQVLYTLLMDTQ
jgi:hypothetical protein